MRIRQTPGFLIALPWVVACAHGPGGAPASDARQEQQRSFSAALGPSKYLIPLPGDDTSLLGRIVMQLPPRGADIEPFTRPNPCAQHLSQPRETRLESQFVDAMGDSAEVNGSILTNFGFGASAGRATHLAYSVSTTRQLVVTDTLEYEACCTQYECGYGFVSSLVYGEGEYASAERAHGEVGARIGVVDLGSGGEFRVLQSRKVRGWLAASVGLTRAPLAVAPSALPPAVAAPIKPGAPAVSSAGAEATVEPAAVESDNPGKLARAAPGEGPPDGEMTFPSGPVTARSLPESSPGLPGEPPTAEGNPPLQSTTLPGTPPQGTPPERPPGPPRPRVVAVPVQPTPVHPALQPAVGMPRLTPPSESLAGGGLESLTFSQQRAFDLGKILVLGTGKDFAFVDSSGKHITENEFINRYEDVSGRDDLDGYWKHRNLGMALGAGLPMLVVGTAMIGGATLIEGDDHSDEAFRMMGYFFGGMLGIAGLTCTITFLALPDGTPKQHSMTEFEAHEHVTRYNELLLERVRNRSSSPAAGVQVRGAFW